MSERHEARWYEPEGDSRVKCLLCPHECRIRDGIKGACGVRVNRRGTLYTLVYDRIIGAHLDPVEKKPLFHFFPGATAWSFGTVGCNLHCVFCQNWHISQWPGEHLPRKLEWSSEGDADLACPELARLGDEIPGEETTPDEIVAEAVASGAVCIAYTYTEPTIFYELAHDTAVKAREQGLRNVFVTNGFISPGPLQEIAGLLDAVNVDLKFARPESHARLSRCRREPILDAVRAYRERGVWVECTTLVIPGVNDGEEELREIARFVRSVGAEVPWHVSQFHPAYKMLDRPPTPVGTLRRAEAIGRDAGLDFVYVGNVPGEAGESTRCPGCGALLIERVGRMRQNRIRDGACPDCGRVVPGVGMSGEGVAHSEVDS